MENITEEQSSPSPYTSLERSKRLTPHFHHDSPYHYHRHHHHHRHPTNMADDTSADSSKHHHSVTKIRMIKRFTIPYSEIVSDTGQNEDNKIINLDISKRGTQKTAEVFQPGIRIQLHLHRPLKWQVTATTSLAPAIEDAHPHSHVHEKSENGEIRELESAERSPQVRLSLISGPGTSASASAASTSSLRPVRSSPAREKEDHNFDVNIVDANLHGKELPLTRPKGATGKSSYVEQIKSQRRSSSSRSRGAIAHRRKRSVKKRHSYTSNYDLDFTSEDSGLSADSETTIKSEDDRGAQTHYNQSYRQFRAQTSHHHQERQQQQHNRKTGHLHLFDPASHLFSSNVSNLDANFLTTQTCDTNSAFSCAVPVSDVDINSNSEQSEGAEYGKLTQENTKPAVPYVAILHESLNQSTTTNSHAYFTRSGNVRIRTPATGSSNSSSSYYKSYKSASTESTRINTRTTDESKCNKLVKKEVHNENWKSWSSSSDTARRTTDKAERSESVRIKARTNESGSDCELEEKRQPEYFGAKHLRRNYNGRREDCDCYGTRQPVMTWLSEGASPLWSSECYKDPSARAAMGANESNLQAQQYKRHNGRDGRLKSRSHSSSALHCMKSSSNNGFVEESFQNRHNTPYPSSHGINGSIPADLWDLPANSQSFSPSRFQNHLNQQPHQQQRSNGNGNGFAGNGHYYDPQQQLYDGRQRQHNRLIQLPVVEALINRARKGYGRKGGGGKQALTTKAAGMSAEDIAEANRAKLYAISCPDVAAHSNANGNLRLHQHNHTAGYFADRRTSSSKSVKDRERSGSTRMIDRDDVDGADDGDNDLRHRHHHQSCANSAFSTPYHQQHHAPHCQQHKCRSSSSERKCSFCASSSSLAYQQQQQKGIIHSEKSQRHRFEKQRSYDSSASTKRSPYHYPFITEDKIFDVHLLRDPRSGLGLSVTGGLDTEECFPGLIRIKKIFPMGPAFHSGRLRPMDLILKANGVPLTGLTNHEALEVLRTTPTQTVLTLFRPPNNIPGLYFQEESQPPAPRLSTSESSLHYQNVPYPPQTVSGKSDQTQHMPTCSHYYYQTPKNQSQPPQISQTDYVYKTCSASSNTAFNNTSSKSKSMSSLKSPPSKIYGEFEITMEKMAGSLGFTLKQEDFSILGHYVRALVKDPALSDGRIQPGDRILAVNGKDLSEMSHEDAITFLRKCPPKVTLRIFRDMARTPISPLSPSESHKSLKPKPLRQEAIDMLSDLALRRKASGNSSDLKCSHSSSGGLMMNRRIGQSNKSLQNESSANGPATLPRRRPGAHAGVTPSPKVLSAALDRFAGRAGTPKSNQSTDSSTITGDGDGEGSSSTNSNKVRRESGLGSSNASYPSETRSSGSGESTPAGTIIQCRRPNSNADKISGANPASNHKSVSAISTPLTSKFGNKTDLSNLGDTKKKLFCLPDESLLDDNEHDSDNSSWYNNEEIDLEDDDDTIEEEQVERKKQLKQYTLHLDRISSLEDDSLDLAPMDSLSSDKRLGRSPKHDGDKFRHGQPSYQSAILHSSASKQNNSLNRKRNLSLSHENVEKFQQRLGQSSRVQLSESQATQAKDASPDADIPSSSSSIVTDTSPNQTQQFGMTPGMNKEKSGNLLKWKGVMLSHSKDDGDRLTDDSDEDDAHKPNGENNLEAVSRGESNGSQHETPEGASNNTLGSTSSPSASSSKSSNSRTQMKPSPLNNSQGESSNNARSLQNGRLSDRHSPDGREFHDSTDELNAMHMSQPKQLPSGEQLFTVQLSRRWCSRLGFSLQGSSGHTHISAIYSDSVAGRDGRLRVGDEVIMVNQSSVRDMATEEVIDLMRKTRGLISITLLRKPTTPESEDILNSSDHQLGLT